MKRAILIAILLIAIAAPTVFAATPAGMTTVWFGDDFESQALTRLRLLVGWTGAGPENKNGLWTVDGTKSIRMNGASGTTTSSEGYNAVGIGGLSAGNLQWVSFMLQTSQQLGQTASASGRVVLTNSAGVEMTRYLLNSSWVGTAAAYTFEAAPVVPAWHKFDLLYDPTSGVFNSYVDGVFNKTFAGATGQAINLVKVYDYGFGPQDQVYFDNVYVGTGTFTPIPEPSSLLAFATFGIAGLGFIRRRRA
ncbi:MAG: PEP-CTERM sorting domain-containing protein [Armatimonadota bacterium]|nr:PEP-CTERM sorting domain-containing protein [Armatimonadota bacterium]